MAYGGDQSCILLALSAVKPYFYTTTVQGHLIPVAKQWVKVRVTAGVPTLSAIASSRCGKKNHAGDMPLGMSHLSALLGMQIERPTPGEVNEHGVVGRTPGRATRVRTRTPMRIRGVTGGCSQGRRSVVKSVGRGVGRGGGSRWGGGGGVGGNLRKVATGSASLLASGGVVSHQTGQACLKKKIAVMREK